MGNKQNACLLRTSINGWKQSIWVAKTKKEFASYVYEDEIIRRYIFAKFGYEKVSSVIIMRLNHKTVVEMKVNKISYFTKVKEEGAESVLILLNKSIKKDMSLNIEVKVSEIQNPDIDASLIAGSIATQMENRQNFKKAAKRAVRNAMKNGAEGINIKLSGRLGGVSIARSIIYKDGTVPLHTLRAHIDQASVQAHTSYGTCGVKVIVARRS